MIKLAKGEHESILSVIESGGFYTIEIDADDIPTSKELVALRENDGTLTTGFEHEPTSAVEDNENISELMRGVDSWGRIQILTKRAGGKITYRKLENGHYEAKVERDKA